MWIKICGITSLEDAEVAIAAGADAIGFVFAESPRRISPETVRDIVKTLPPPVEKIGVFVDGTLDEMVKASEIGGLTGLQLHGSRRDVRAQVLRTRAGKTSGSLRIVQVVRYNGDAESFGRELHWLRENVDGEDDAVLVDTCVAGKQGGTGLAFDWLSARDNFLREELHFRLIAAGGLRPENVREVIHTLRPWGVDVSSGVEITPGRKDPARVAAFIREARQIEMELGKAARV